MKLVASAGDAEGGKEGLGGWGRPDLARHGPGRLGGRIEPAEPEPLPAHSTGWFREDTMRG